MLLAEGKESSLNYIKKYCSFPLPSTAKLRGAQNCLAHPEKNELQNSRTELFLSSESWNVQDPGAGWGRKWVLFWQQPWGCAGCPGAACTAQLRECVHRSHAPERVGDAVGQGRSSERTGLCLPSVPALFCCSFGQAVSLHLSLALCVPLCQRFPFEEKPRNKNLFSQLFKAELSGHFYLLIPAL